MIADEEYICCMESSKKEIRYQREKKIINIIPGYSVMGFLISMKKF